jgi:hypothetical protein
MAPTDSAAANDSFSVLLRYADATGEKVRITTWDLDDRRSTYYIRV